MPPEAILAPETVDARSDLYSLGAFAYFLLTGKPVFAGKTVLEVCARTVNDDIVLPSTRSKLPIPRTLEALVMECLAKSRDERPSSAEGFLDRLHACDDVEKWTADDARDWWRKNAVAITRRAHANETNVPNATLTVAPRSVDTAAS